MGSSAGRRGARVVSEATPERSFVVRVEGGSKGAVTAHIVPAADLQGTLAEHGAQLGDSVVGLISDLLAELVREEQGDGDAAG